MKTKFKKKLRVLWVVLILTFCGKNVQAYDDSEHSKQLERVLFGSETFKNGKTEEIKNKIQALENASAITLDQYNGSYKDKIQFLKDRGVANVPSVEDINFGGNEKHRMYTHKGWDFEYVKDKGNWSKRKELLLSTVNKELDFGMFSKFLWFDYSEKCNSFSAFIYYVHVLGDYLECEWKTRDNCYYMIHFADSHDKNYSLTEELMKHFSILFKDQETTRAYKELINGIKTIDNTATSVINGSGGVDTEEEFAVFKQCVNDLMNLLIERVPELLKSEKFFKNSFYQ